MIEYEIYLYSLKFKEIYFNQNNIKIILVILIDISHNLISMNFHQNTL